MALADIIQTDLAVIQSDMGNPVFTWQSEDYACAPGSANNTLIVAIGGFEQQADLVLYASTDAFSDGIYPTSQQTLVYRSQTYRIAKVTADPLQALIELACVSATRGV